MKKIIIFSFLLSLFFLTVPLTTLAQNLPIKDSATTVVGTGVAQSLPPPVEPPPCEQLDSSEIDLSLLSNFGVTITGDSADCRAKEIAFTTYSTLFQSEKYASLVRNAGGTTITMTNGACGGKASGDNFRIGDCNNSSLPYFFVHEMAHIVGHNSSIDSAFKTALTSLVESDSDGDCYDGRFLKTYLLRTGVTASSESFAESVALYYLGKRTRGVGAPITDFKSQCPLTYSLIKDAVFGGYEFGIGGGTGDGGIGGKLVTFQIGNHTVTTNYRSSNDCDGKTYGRDIINLSNALRFPIGNFGDPNCDFSKDAVVNLIKQLDPGVFVAKNGKRYNRYAVWDGIIHCESGYNPNSLNRNSSSGWGAWGLFQMNPDFSGRALHDNGSTDWRNQIENAITRNNNVSEGGFGYWSCAGGFRRGTKEPRI